MAGSPQTTRELKVALLAAYEVAPRTARTDLDAFIRDAQRFGFLESQYDTPPQPTEQAETDAATALLLDIERSAVDALVPFSVTFETTYRCNERCLHCYIDRPADELSLQEIEATLVDLADLGCLFLTLTGGELFARRDALEIIQTAARHHFVIDLLTNGTLIRDDELAVLARVPLQRVQISLYGSDCLRHDRITRVPGSFTATVATARALSEAGIKVEIAMSLLKENVDDAHAVRALANELGCAFLPSPLISARNDGSADTHALRLSDEQLFAFYADPSLSGLYYGRQPFEDHERYMDLTDLAKAPPCYSGFCSCAIRPNGDVVPCNQLLLRLGNVRDQPLSEIWLDSPALRQLRMLTIGDLAICSRCKLLAGCARCPGLAMLEGGDIRGPSPENCRIARIRHAVRTATWAAGVPETELH